MVLGEVISETQGGFVEDIFLIGFRLLTASSMEGTKIRRMSFVDGVE